MKRIKNANRINPLIRLNGTLIKLKATTVIIIKRGNVVFRTHGSTTISLIIANTPITKNIFAILEPITLPTAISL